MVSLVLEREREGTVPFNGLCHPGTKSADTDYNGRCLLWFHLALLDYPRNRRQNRRTETGEYELLSKHSLLKCN